MEAASAAVRLESSLLLRSSSFRRTLLASYLSFSISPSRALFSFPFLVLLPLPRRSPVAVCVAVEDTDLKEYQKAVGGVYGAADEKRRRFQPCELYVCNLPRSYDKSHLLELFKPYGVIHSVEVSRDKETGISRGSGYVTMGSISEAKSVIKALDGSPEDLREHFSKYGTVASTRVLHDRRRGRNRAYAFLSFSSPDEVKAATEANESVFHGVIVVKEVVDQEP